MALTTSGSSISAVSRVSLALRKLATALSPNFGSDCYLHMELGHILLGDLGMDSRRVLGFASWRVGPGEGDVLSYRPGAHGLTASIPKALPYHAWLDVGNVIVDFSTYQFKFRAKQLDAADGQRTTVDWCPGFLMIPHAEVRSHPQVQQAIHSGLAYYEAYPDLERTVGVGEPADPEGVRAARWLLANPNRSVVGPRRPIADE